MDDFIKQKKAEWEALSETYRKRFEKEKSPDVIINFLKKSPDAIHESWVVSEIIKWVINKNTVLLKKAFLPGIGQRVDSNPNMMALRKLAILNFVQHQFKKGATTYEAFEKASEIKWYDVVYGPDTVRNLFYKAKKMKPQICVKDDTEKISVFVGPTKVTWEQDCRFSE